MCTLKCHQSTSNKSAGIGYCPKRFHAYSQPTAEIPKRLGILFIYISSQVRTTVFIPTEDTWCRKPKPFTTGESRDGGGNPAMSPLPVTPEQELCIQTPLGTMPLNPHYKLAATFSPLPASACNGAIHSWSAKVKEVHSVGHHSNDDASPIYKLTCTCTIIFNSKQINEVRCTSDHTSQTSTTLPPSGEQNGSNSSYCSLGLRSQPTEIQLVGPRTNINP